MVAKEGARPPISAKSGGIFGFGAPMPLTAVEISQAKPRDNEYKLSDGGGLYLLIRPNGAKLWKHKVRIQGREQKLSYGAYSGTEMTGHGFRSTASTLLNESNKWRPDIIERALAHADPNAIRSIYNRAQYWAERVEMAQWWSDYLDELKHSAQAS